MDWIYLLVLAPMLTDLLEAGHLPLAPRGWITEVVVGALIGVLVHSVRRQQHALLRIAVTDSLTGLPNRRAFDDALADDCARAARSGSRLSLVYLDLDGFKAVNDRDGHAAGDRVLRQFAAALRGGLRSRVDSAFRIGGDEFAVILPGSDATHAAAVIDRIRARCAAGDPLWAGGALGVSAGVVELGAHEPPADLVRRADDAMYARKEQHRRRGGTST